MAHGFFALTAAFAAVAVFGLVMLRRRLRARVELEAAEETLRRDFDDRVGDSLR